MHSIYLDVLTLLYAAHHHQRSPMLRTNKLYTQASHSCCILRKPVYQAYGELDMQLDSFGSVVDEMKCVVLTLLQIE